MELSAADARDRLELLAELGYGFVESGQTSGQTERVLRDCARSLGLSSLGFNSFGRLLLLETTSPDGGTVSVQGAAKALDFVDCARARKLSAVADELTDRGEQPDLADAHRRVALLRRTATPWWARAFGMTLLAFAISMQVGVTWHAWVAAALVQVVTSLTGLLTARWTMPSLLSAAVCSSAGGAFATLLVKIGFVDPVGAAAAIAVTWLLLLPLPQIIGAVTDAIDADHLSALTRVASVLVAGVGVFVGGAFTFALGELLDMDHPKLDHLPTFPWYAILVFSALGAIANAFANGGTLSLVGPAATLGVVTGTVNQVLLRVADAPTLWANSASAVVLGVLTVVLAARTGYPQPVLALMGVTGALLPGIPVFFGILQEMGEGSGAAYFGQAATICVGIGAGVAFGAWVTERARSRRTSR
ncbi:MAG: threonine/serine exporter family protein [Aeromicrobium sp.]|uniref:threonine/serine exporter family protein n=1 Tax=Aeromicrobium sp. TaxID=1871063 RepID=UPI0039E50525